MRVAHREHQRDGACAAAVQVAQRERQVLHGVRSKLVLIGEHVIVHGAGGALYAGVRLKVEVVLVRVAYRGVDHRPSRHQ